VIERSFGVKLRQPYLPWHSAHWAPVSMIPAA
jgi:hypothetical protein